MRKRYQKDSLANMKNSGEIHEQLVTYDEEGGGEMDTNGYADEKKHCYTLLNWQLEYNWNELTWFISSPPFLQTYIWFYFLYNPLKGKIFDLWMKQQKPKNL